MSSTKFIAILPQKVQPGDKIRLKGRITPNAEEFSINFANESCANPLNITYHFKWLLCENIVVENYKDNGMWMDHKEIEYNKIDGRLIDSTDARLLDSQLASNNGFHTNVLNNDLTNSFSGPTFGLEYAFQDDGIYVYLLEDGGHNIITHFEPLFELSDIRSVQVWGDVEKIHELTFVYK